LLWSLHRWEESQGAFEILAAHLVTLGG
jgi:hypothetical protein